GQADVQHAAVFVLAHGFQLFTTGHTHGQALWVGEKIPHLLAWGGKSLGTGEFHRRSFARSTARSAVLSLCHRPGQEPGTLLKKFRTCAFPLSPFPFPLLGARTRTARRTVSDSPSHWGGPWAGR